MRVWPFISVSISLGCITIFTATTRIFLVVQTIIYFLEYKLFIELTASMLTVLVLSPHTFCMNIFGMNVYNNQ